MDTFKVGDIVWCQNMDSFTEYMFLSSFSGVSLSTMYANLIELSTEYQDPVYLRRPPLDKVFRTKEEAINAEIEKLKKLL